MIKELELAFEAAMTDAEREIAAGRLDCAMSHLERAHVLGQYHVGPHVQAHWWMLRIAFQRKRFGEAAGQAVRIVLGAIGSASGRVPRGNTGGSDVSMFKAMPVDPLIANLIDRDRADPR